MLSYITFSKKKLNLLNSIESEINEHFVELSKENLNALSYPLCVESGAGGHEGVFINLIHSKTKDKVYCGKKIDLKNPNEYIFYSYIVKVIHDKDNKLYTIMNNFYKYMCHYHGIFHKNTNKYYMIMDNAKASFNNPITIDIKIGGFSYRKGENNTEYKKKTFDNYIKSTRHKIINTHMTISSKIGSRVEGITGIVRKINYNILKSPNICTNKNINTYIHKITNKQNGGTFNNYLKNKMINSYLLPKYKKYISNLLKTPSLKDANIVSLLSSFISSSTKKKLKERLMKKNPLSIFNTLLNPSNESNKNILYKFEQDLYDIITNYIKNNLDLLINNKYYFSFVGSSLLFIYDNNQRASVKFIDFGHPVNLYIDGIKLSSKKEKLVQKSVIDYSIGIINIYIMIFYLLNDTEKSKINKLLDILKILDKYIDLLHIKMDNITYKDVYKHL